MSYTEGNYEGYKNWKVYIVTVSIRAKNEADAKKFVEMGFDSTMSFEDKIIHIPKIVKVEVIEK